MRKNHILFLLLFCLYFVALKAQNKAIDSLNRIIKNESEDFNKVNTISEIADQYFYQGELNICIIKCKEGIRLSEILDYKNGIGRLCNRMGCCYTEQGNYADALKILFKGLKINKEIKSPRIIDSYQFIGNCFNSQDKLEKALEYYTLGLTVSKEMHDSSGIASGYGAQAMVYHNQGKDQEALKIYFECLKMMGTDSSKFSAYAINIANAYESSSNYKEALKYNLLAQKYCERVKNKRLEAYALSNLADLYLKLNNTTESKNSRIKSILRSKETENKELLRYGYSALASIDSAQGNYKGAFENHKLSIAYRDSIINIESQKSIIEQEAKNEYEKKEELAKLELAKKEELAKSEKQKQKVILFSVIGGLLLVIVFSVSLYQRFRQAQQQKNIIEKQKHLIEEHQKETIDSITYAKRIQDAILPPIDLIVKKLPNSFVLFKPKDIVAGDFYWLESITLRNVHLNHFSNESAGGEEEVILIAAADCTGHGVPGAMVSVVCSNALNRAVKEFKLADTGAILDKVTDLVLETFEKSTTDVKDGMDISLLSINKASKQIQWSGANNPLWYFENAELKEIKADKQPIGKSDHRKPFTTHVIDYKVGTTFYLFTDGYADQFGGPKGKKFKYKQLQEILSNNLSEEPIKQHNQLKTAFENWKGSAEQVDDVCIIGIVLS